ncbi:MAG: hypothetical protein ACXAC7_07540 [Candidatus Hodarchaeales archaeon]|jgi:hypothetical protein
MSQKQNISIYIYRLITTIIVSIIALLSASFNILPNFNNWIGLLAGVITLGSIRLTLGSFTPNKIENDTEISETIDEEIFLTDEDYPQVDFPELNIDFSKRLNSDLKTLTISSQDTSEIDFLDTNLTEKKLIINKLQSLEVLKDKSEIGDETYNTLKTQYTNKLKTIENILYDNTQELENPEIPHPFNETDDVVKESENPSIIELEEPNELIESKIKDKVEINTSSDDKISNPEVTFDGMDKNIAEKTELSQEITPINIENHISNKKISAINSISDGQLHEIEQQTLTNLEKVSQILENELNELKNQKDEKAQSHDHNDNELLHQEEKTTWVGIENIEEPQINPKIQSKEDKVNDLETYEVWDPAKGRQDKSKEDWYQLKTDILNVEFYCDLCNKSYLIKDTAYEMNEDKIADSIVVHSIHANSKNKRHIGKITIACNQMQPTEVNFSKMPDKVSDIEPSLPKSEHKTPISI